MSLLLLALTSANSQTQPFQAQISGTPEDHSLQWLSKPNLRYFFQLSEDLQSWQNTGDFVLGDGTEKNIGFNRTEGRLFYRVHETGFLVLPTPSQRMDLIDGVCFDFNLALLSQLPAKIRLFSRTWNTGAPWSQIGLITDLAMLRNVRTVRGSVVWIPPSTGQFEVKAEAVDAAGGLLGADQRHIIVGSNRKPTITINGFLAPPFVNGTQSPTFDVSVSDPDGDEIRRVEYFTNGVLIGQAVSLPFANARDVQNQEHPFFKGAHQVTARVYDARGEFGETTAPFNFTVNVANSKPILMASLANAAAVTQQRLPLVINIAASDPDGAGDLRRIEAVDIIAPVTRRAFANVTSSGTFALTLQTSGWELGNHIIEVTAFDRRLANGNPDTVGTKSIPIFLNVFIRSASPARLAESLLANLVEANSVVTLPGAVFRGVVLSTAEFTGGTASGLQMNSGIVMTTGKASDWNAGDLPPLPDEQENSEETTTAWGVSGDAALRDRVVGTSTNDAAILDFEVTTIHGQLEWEFQFGSEEYDEYISQFNDGFMITVDGVIVNLLPDCSDIVAVNTLHNGQRDSQGNYLRPPLNSHLFLDDDTDIDPTVTNQSKQVDYDGLSVKPRSHVLVSPGTHRIRIVIADVTDYLFDSALFLKQGSLRSIQPQP